MLRKTIIVPIVIVFILSLSGCNDSNTENLKAENEQLKERVELLEETLADNDISIPDKNSSKNVDNDAAKEEEASDDSKVKGKFSEITFEALDKINTESNYSEFVKIPYKLTNHYDKEIKGVQGTLYIKDMFGEPILTVAWDISTTPIPAGGYIQEDEYGLDINQFMDDHMKVYNNSYENLIFEYEPTKVLFTDGTIIE